MFKTRRSPEPEARGVAAAMTALVLVVLLATLDQTIVATALPRIAADLDGFDGIAWISAAYLLASTAVTPLWGKLGDMFGRKTLYLVSTTVFLIASAACGLAQGLPELIGARVLQGLGGGGMIVLTFALVGDIVAAEERGRYQAMFGSVYGVASIVGPLLGGVFTDRLSWRWAFLVNLPVGVIALVIAVRVLPAAGGGVKARIDYAGATVLAAIATGLVLVTSFGGRWGWGSPAIVGLVLATVALAALLVPVERRAAAPVLPIALLSSRTVVFSALIGFVANAAMFSVLVYLPTYLQIVDGVSATLSGVHMLPLVAGLVLSQSLAGRWAAQVERLRPILVSGLLINLAGLLLLSTLGAATGTVVLGGYFLLTGIGIGMVPMVVLTAVQNSVPAADIGAASAVVTFARSIGAAFGVAVFGALLTSGFAARTADLPRLGGFDPARPESIARLSADARAVALDAFAHATGAGFLWLAPALAAGTVLALLLKRPRPAPAQEPTRPAEARPAVS
ncbi:EmrB/QacA subfamily drug resistance transporter [Actinocorallia herbida]|uniref:EmrB/QacA subfamily drug resistance transporter n=1 Tax=Actinocorallia herbida TaxID=58109 RepID=A0A3N1D092_9ACTN|nr:MDR family MFS transporter [Actinocorallia herbida]ROO86943.1 EmrB/QacA subfamily drug resistance transporter [Actinocorallia herbida]